MDVFSGPGFLPDVDMARDFTVLRAISPGPSAFGLSPPNVWTLRVRVVDRYVVLGLEFALYWATIQGGLIGCWAEAAIQSLSRFW